MHYENGFYTTEIGSVYAGHERQQYKTPRIEVRM